jgi:hypothetical protein
LVLAILPVPAAAATASVVAAAIELFTGCSILFESDCLDLNYLWCLRGGWADASASDPQHRVVESVPHHEGKPFN